MFGSLWLANTLHPVFYGIAIWIGTTGILYAVRFSTEKLMYDQSRSSMPGDMFLATHIAIVAWMWQQSHPSGIHTSIWWQVCIVMVALALGLWWHDVNCDGDDLMNAMFNELPAQVYHNLVVIPVFIYLIVSMSPVLVMAYRGHPIMALLAVLCPLVWASLVVVDIKYGNFEKLKQYPFYNG